MPEERVTSLFKLMSVMGTGSLDTYGTRWDGSETTVFRHLSSGEGRRAH